MNRGKKIIQMRKFINKYGVIEQEYKRPPDKEYPPYRKGSYFVSFYSEQLSLSCAIGDVDKYTTYKEIVKIIKGSLDGSLLKGVKLNGRIR